MQHMLSTTPSGRWARGAASCTSDVQSGSTSSGSSGGTCIGGIIVNGKCEAKCAPNKCLPGNTCVNNQCVLQCTSHNDCYTGTQNCVAAKEDGTSADIMICKSNGLAAIGASCPFGDCSGVTSCPDGKFCDYTQCNGQPCAKDAAACGDDASCTIGVCPDKSACTVSACPADQCKPLKCLTAGDADADAYCTLPDCMGDQDCPGGFFCGTVRDPHAVCNAMPPKGNNNACGKTAEPCIDPANKPPGTTYFEGSVCLLRKMCLKRIDCTPCANALDCSLVLGQSCVGTGPSQSDMRCEQGCKIDKDCGPSYHCVSNACVPRFTGGCAGTGKFCEPCQTDEDCGMKGSTRECITLDLSGERACLDAAFPDACDPLMNDADCPKSPSGRNGHCLSENEGLMPGDKAYHKCYLPYDPNSNKYSCW